MTGTQPQRTNSGGSSRFSTVLFGKQLPILRKYYICLETLHSLWAKVGLLVLAKDKRIVFPEEAASVQNNIYCQSKVTSSHPVGSYLSLLLIPIYTSKYD